MTLILDSGGVSALAQDRAKLSVLLKRGHWPALVPAAVLTESLTGDHRRDFHENKLLRTCTIETITELTAREAAFLRTATKRAVSTSPVDAIVVALAGQQDSPVIVTGDPKDIADLTAVSHTDIKVISV